MGPISEHQAYVAIDNDGFVDGACFTQSDDADRWVANMQATGMTVEIRDRAEAKRILFTHVKSEAAQSEVDQGR